MKSCNRGINPVESSLQCGRARGTLCLFPHGVFPRHTSDRLTRVGLRTRVAGRTFDALGGTWLRVAPGEASYDAGSVSVGAHIASFTTGTVCGIPCSVEPRCTVEGVRIPEMEKALFSSTQTISIIIVFLLLFFFIIIIIIIIIIITCIIIIIIFIIVIFIMFIDKINLHQTK